MSIHVKENVTLAPYTIYKIGGAARFFVEAVNADEVREALEFAAEKNLPIFILGAGSNILINDKGFDGLVVRMIGGELKVEGCKLTVGAGAMMACAVTEAAKAGLTGFEWGIGVPGTIGGSVRGNAGCFGGEMKDVIESVEVFDAIKTISDKRQAVSCEFSYRDSIFKKHPEWIILSATLKLHEGDPQVIQENIKRITRERSKKQDIGTKSCGCIFKNVSWTRGDINKEKLLLQFLELAQFKDKLNTPASFLIDQVGRKGKCFGRICISPKHANFFVNEGGATAEEAVIAIAAAKDAVKNKYGILLEEEIEYVGF